MPKRDTRSRARRVRANWLQAILWLAVTLPFLTANTSAQLAPRFQHLDASDGLTQSSVQTIVQDQIGFIWIGTQQGLNRYDGVEFRSYFSDPVDQTTLPHDFIWVLHIDTQKRLWVGTEKGLARFDPRLHSFVRYHDVNLSGYAIRTITEDSSGKLWLGTDGQGIVQLDPITGTANRFSHPKGQQNSSRKNHIKALEIDNHGLLWVGSDGGLHQFDPIKNKFSEFTLGDSDVRVRSLETGSEGFLWLGTTEHGLYRLNVKTGTTQHFDTSTFPDLSSNSIRAIHKSTDGMLWIGHDAHGLSRFDGTKFSTYKHSPENSRSLADDHVSAIFEDNNNVLWIGSLEGISKWSANSAGFYTYSGHGIQPGELSNNWVSSFAEESPSKIWVGTAGGGINLLDLETGSATTFQHDPNNINSLSEDRVHALLKDNEGQLWVGTRAAGLDRYNPKTRQWHHYRNDPTDDSTLSFDGVTNLIQDNAGQIWVSTYLGGLNLYLPESDTFQRFQFDPKDPHSVCLDRPLVVYEDRSRMLWIGSHFQGLCRFDPRTGELRAFLHDPLDATSLSGSGVFSVAEDHLGNLWIGTTDGGLNLWRAEDRAENRAELQHIGITEGLPSPVVYGLLTELDGGVWIGGNRGLSKYDLATQSFVHFTARDGLQSNEFNQGAAIRTSTGRLIFGGPRGLTAFWPKQLAHSDKPIPIALTGFFKFNEEQIINLTQQQAIKLSHDDSMITFAYAAMDFNAPKQIRYQHKLDGFDTDWIDDATHHRATYTNLNPGRYVFRARVAGSEAYSEKTQLAIPLHVLPPPWATWWAYSTYLLIFGLITFWVSAAWTRREALAAHIKLVNMTLVKEITQRKSKETALRDEREITQRYLDVVEVIILALDHNGTITMVNQKGVRVLGVPEKDIVGQDFCSQFVPMLNRHDVHERILQVDQYAYSESPITTEDGTERLIAWHTIPLPVEYDQEGGVLMSGADVTQVRNLELQLREAQKMESLGTLARGVAHDFNNILSAILGYAELSRGEISGTHPARTYLNRLDSSVARARELIQSILTFGRGSNLELKPVDVTEVVAEAIQLVRPILPNNVILKESLSTSSGTVLADPSQLIQIVLNLCTNACQAMDKQGGILHVVLEAHQVDLEEARSLAVLQPGPHIRLVISDTGSGMDDYTQSRMFDPFFTTRKTGEGTGLGLAVVHGIVTQLQGLVKVESKQGEGTHFSILLPCRENLQFEVDPPSDHQNNIDGSESILFVDDETALTSIAEQSLGKLGYKVFIANDAQQALEILSTKGNTIELLVTDQTMPNMLGEHLAKIVKQEYPHIVVLLVSGADQPQGSDIDAFLHKPYSTSELGRSIRRILTLEDHTS